MKNFIPGGLILTMTLIAGVVLPKALIHDSSSVVPKYAECAKTATRLLLDNPIERVLLSLGGLAVREQQREKVYVTAYTLFGIKYAVIKVRCINDTYGVDGDAERMWDVLHGEGNL
jgi:hypothetical protein